MFFFPFKVDFRLARFPLVTLLIMLVCTAIFWSQTQSDARWANARGFACSQADESFRAAWNQDGRSSVETCVQRLEELSRVRDPQAKLSEIAADIAAGPNADRLSDTEATAQSLNDFWQGAQRLGGSLPLTPRLAYEPHSWNPWRMITAAFAHAGWGHLLGNLFFFYLFATTIEGVLGVWRFTAFVLVLALGTHVVYSIASLGSANAPATIGLSGVVYGVMGLFAYFLPDAKIRSIVWLFLQIRIMSVSAVFIAVWYIGGDALSLLISGNHGGINLVAHVSGAVIAIMLGMTLFRDDRDWTRLEAKPHLQPYI